MNGAQDLGGQMGFGRVLAEPDEPVFHAPWEGRVLALNLLAGALGEWNTDVSRNARESLHPVTYLSASYYEIWLRGLTKLLAARDLVLPAELRGEAPVGAPRATRRGPLSASAVKASLRRGGPSDRPTDRPAGFAVGQRVRTVHDHPSTHTRLPRYARGRVGTIEAVRGSFVYPDSVVLGRGEDPQWLYTVVFEGDELWGGSAAAGVRVSVDAFEPYLSAAVS